MKNITKLCLVLMSIFSFSLHAKAYNPKKHHRPLHYRSHKAKSELPVINIVNENSNDNANSNSIKQIVQMVQALEKQNKQLLENNESLQKRLKKIEAGVVGQVVGSSWYASVPKWVAKQALGLLVSYAKIYVMGKLGVLGFVSNPVLNAVKSEGDRVFQAMENLGKSGGQTQGSSWMGTISTVALQALLVQYVPYAASFAGYLNPMNWGWSSKTPVETVRAHWAHKYSV